MVLRRPSPFVVAVFGALLWMLAGCTSIPKGRSAIDDVSIRGASKVDDSDIEERLATAATPKFLGMFRGVVFEYELFDRFVLQRDLARVERFYRARGYYDAHARAGRVTRISENHVQVEIVVEEGTPIRVRNVTLVGAEGLSPDEAKAVRKAIERNLGKGNAPFDEDKYKEAETAATRALTDRGYAYAKADRDASIDLVAHSADVSFSITPGHKVRFGAVTYEGLETIPLDPVKRALDIQPGEPYSTADLDAAQQAVLDLQVFSSVEVVPDLAHPESGEVPVHVKVEPSKLRTLKLGGGVEFDIIRSDFHLLAGWEHHNYLGGLRTLSVQFRPGVVTYPLRVDNIVVPHHLLPMEKLRLELRQPGLFEARTNGFIRPEFNVIPFIPPLDKKLLDKASIIGYAEAKIAVGLDRTFGKFYGALVHSVNVAHPFSYIGELDPALRTLVISSPELIVNLDLRDDRVHPHKGIFLGNNLQIAGGVFGGDASDIKIQPEIRGYIPLPHKMTIAMRVGVGLLFPFNYGKVVRENLDQALTDANRGERTRDFQIMYFRGLFSGGSSSNRGYPLRSIGPHAFVPFLNPDLASLQLDSDCFPTNSDGTTRKLGNECGIAVGGFTLWETSVEARIPLSGPLSSAIFCDASDVSPQRVHFRFNRPHLSCGVGVRYDTPVGPIRLDLGYRIPGMQVLRQLSPNAPQGKVSEQFQEGEPDEFLGIPIALAFGIGESF
ncbi:autotransporter assembly complex family protein [Pendulispora albinea]|uniref:BamA/TamA family outer membrane protein n=1 Tax=Pendulispora albinea TaxID=2741071 RepID=A0ABZ2LNA4_9BACT